jgi:hypothetical protein
MAAEVPPNVDSQLAALKTRIGDLASTERDEWAGGR